MTRLLRGRLAEGVLGEKLGLDAPLARANAQFHEQSAPEFANRAGDQPVGANRPRDARTQYNLIEPTLVGPRPGPVLHQVVLIRAPEQGEYRTRRQPTRPGQADLKVDQTRLASLADEDVFALV